MYKTAIIIPTYNENSTIGQLLDRLIRLELKTDTIILVIDDNSPDGTSDTVKRIAEDCSNIHIIQQHKKLGRGTAGVAGYKWALDQNADIIIELDGDLSHAPEDIPAFLENIQSADVVIGSRYISGGMDLRTNYSRKIISFLARFFINHLWNIEITDPTSGYRCFKKSIIEHLINNGITSKNQFFILETLHSIINKGYSIIEIPIVFNQRASGSSKLKVTDLLDCLIKVVKLKDH